jgi:hypothetical protein
LNALGCFATTFKSSGESSINQLVKDAMFWGTRSINYFWNILIITSDIWRLKGMNFLVIFITKSKRRYRFFEISRINRKLERRNHPINSFFTLQTKHSLRA